MPAIDWERITWLTMRNVCNRHKDVNYENFYFIKKCVLERKWRRKNREQFPDFYCRCWNKSRLSCIRSLCYGNRYFVLWTVAVLKLWVLGRPLSKNYYQLKLFIKVPFVKSLMPQCCLLYLPIWSGLVSFCLQIFLLKRIILHRNGSLLNAS